MGGGLNIFVNCIRTSKDCLIFTILQHSGDVGLEKRISITKVS